MTTVYRVVGPEEYSSIVESGEFSFPPNGSEMKQLGFNLNETLDFSNFQTDYAAIIQGNVPSSALSNFNISNQIDPFIFRSEILTVNGPDGLSLFNSLVTNVGRAY
jgi:filamentous hemagglutinin